jgi:hypothetical protein
MSYGEVYIESDINKMQKAGYKKKFIINTIVKRIRYRYPDITKIAATRIALGVYNNSDTSAGWKSRRRSGKEPKITNRDILIWNKLDLGSL